MSHCLRCGEQVPEGTCTCPRPVLVPSLAPEALVARVQELRAEIAEMDKRIAAEAARRVELFAEWDSEEYADATDRWRELREQRDALIEDLNVVATTYFDALEEPASAGREPMPLQTPEELCTRVQELRAEIAEMDTRIERAADEWEREIYLREKREDLVEELCTVATSFIDALEEAGPTVYAKYRRLHAPEGPEALAARMDQIRAEVARLSAKAGALYDRAWDVENGPALGSDEYTAIMDEWHTVMQERFALLAKLTVVRDQYRQALEEPAP